VESKTIWFVLKSVCRPQDYGCHRGCPGSTSKQVFIKCLVWISLVCPLFKSFKCIRRALLYVELVLIARGASKAFGQFGLHLATDLYHYITLWITESFGVPLAFSIMKLIQVIRPTQGVGHSVSALSLHCGTSTGSYLRLNTRMVRHGATWCDNCPTLIKTLWSSDWSFSLWDCSHLMLTLVGLWLGKAPGRTLQGRFLLRMLLLYFAFIWFHGFSHIQIVQGLVTVLPLLPWFSMSCCNGDVFQWKLRAAGTAGALFNVPGTQLRHAATCHQESLLIFFDSITFFFCKILWQRREKP